MSRDEIIEQVTKFLWECDQEGTTPEWREMAWNDMGGSEPTDERQVYELRAQTLADAGLLARPVPTREQLADTIWDALEDGGWVSTSGHYPYEIADAVLAPLKGQDA